MTYFSHSVCSAVYYKAGSPFTVIPCLPNVTRIIFFISEKNETKPTQPNKSDTKVHDTTEQYNNQYKINPDDGRNRKYSKMINPIYISVPVAGACVLLAIIIFAIFLLKRKNRDHFYRDYNMTNNANDMKHSECCAGNGAVKQPKSHTYPETERTSASSESKLLMKV
jgi:hypothetical protein